MKTFRNPISPFSAPDPFMTYDPVTGFYYSLFTRGKKLELFRSRHAAEICTNGDSQIIYEPNGERDGIWGDIWAPEMHKAPNGKWYIYTSGRKDKEPSAKRLFIMEALTDDPFGAWRFKCKPTPDVFSIDPTVYTAANGQQFICYSRVERGQVLDICALENPWTLGAKRAMISPRVFRDSSMPHAITAVRIMSLACSFSTLRTNSKLLLKKDVDDHVLFFFNDSAQKTAVRKGRDVSRL